LIRFENATKYYDDAAVLRDITFSISRGEFAFISGPSGAGKTTLLRLVFLAEKLDSGSISVDDVEINGIRDSRVPHLRRKIGVVFQDFRLLNRSIYDNVALAMRIRGIRESAIKPQVHETLKLVNLRHKVESLPFALSGGEQQRVAIARAIVGEPAVILADEPTGNLDPDTATGILRLFAEINARGTTILFATHNREIFRRSGKRVFRLDQGRISQEAGL
jgi:cell division transport system ATP-binding protein